jgi:hypothetical protein
MPVGDMAVGERHHTAVQVPVASQAFSCAACQRTWSATKVAMK